MALDRLQDLETRAADAVLPIYDRRRFGWGWRDRDGDGQDERAETLISRHRPGRGKVEIGFATGLENRVVSGRWRCRFTGDWVTDAGDLDIDHIVPLSEAWKSGAHAWTRERRIRYANGSSLHALRKDWLIPVTSRMNRSKGSRRPDQWLPPNEAYHLTYAADWIRTKSYWSLSVLEIERKVLVRLLEKHDV